MQDDRRRGGEFPAKGILLAWLAVCAILMVAASRRLVEGQFPDPDDALRLVQLRDLMAGQAWFDTTQYRIDPPGGTLMHWSRIVDVPLLAMVALLTPVLGVAMAETVTIVAVPLLLLGLTILVIGRLSWRLFDARTAVYASLACGFLSALLFQFLPMRIDHHGWQVFTVVLALWSISWRDARHGGAVAGLAMALGASISLEILPMAAAFAGVLFLRWWADFRLRWWLVAFMQGLSLGLLALFAATRGLANPVQHCDAISPAHLGFFLVAALGTTLIAARAQMRGFGLVVLFGITGIAALAFFAISSPTCVSTPFARLDPVVDYYWYRRVLEGQPLWAQEPDVFLPAAIQMSAAIATTVLLLARSHDWMRRWWTEYLLLLLASVLLSLLVSRSLAMASAIAAIPMGWLAASLLDRLRTMRTPLAKAGGMLAFLLLLAPSAPFVIAEKMEAAAMTGGTVAPSLAESRCVINDQAARLNRLPKGLVLAPLDIGPAILLKSHQSVVATGHHRAETAMADVIRAFTSPPHIARGVVEAHHAHYLVLCTDLIEPQLYATRAPSGLAASLLRGDAPEWLEKLELGGPEEFVAYRVRQTAR